MEIGIGLVGGIHRVDVCAEKGAWHRVDGRVHGLVSLVGVLRWCHVSLAKRTLQLVHQLHGGSVVCAS